jgi:hypothetical protein
VCTVEVARVRSTAEQPRLGNLSPAAVSSAVMRSRASSKRKAEKLRSWRVSILRQRAKHLGDVEAPDQKAAEAEAVKEFNLDDEQRRRLVVQERDET